MTLTNQLAALADISETGGGFLSERQVATLDELHQQTLGRRALSAEHTTVGLFGATGSGKSSLFNALAGQELATTGVLRPTTSRTAAAVWQPEGSSSLLDWLQVQEVWASPSQHATPLILLDLPDFDSLAAENRQVVDRLVGQVDVLIWVMDPQKYADRMIHRDYIQPLAHQSSVTMVVLNQIDLLNESQAQRVVASLRTLLDDDGLTNVPIFPVSAASGVGIAPLWAALEQIATLNTAATQRLSGDISAWAVEAMPPSPPAVATSIQQGKLVEQVSAAVGVNAIADDVAAAYRKRSGETTGWLLTSWVSRLRPDPLRRLRVEGNKDFPVRTSLPPMSAVNQAVLSTAVREYSAGLGGGLPPAWREELTSVTRQAVTGLPDALDRKVGSIPYRAEPSWWWGAANALQWVAALVTLVGVGWYLVAWASAALGLPIIHITKFEGWPVPGMLVVFGLLLGLVLGMLFTLWGRAVARLRRRAAQKALTRQVEVAVQETIAAPLAAVMEQAGNLYRQLQVAAG